MTVNADLLDQISRESNLDRDTLISKGVQSFLKEKKTALMLERLEILSRYRVRSREELQHKIETGEVDDHPAWEDLIVVENVEAGLRKIDGYLEHL
jgi:hypothetical protein